MRNLKPEIKKLVVASLVSISLIGSYATVTNSQTSAISLITSVVDGDTAKISLGNIEQVPKSIQFSVKLDDKMKLVDGTNSIRLTETFATSDKIASGEVMADFVYNSDNTIDVIITSLNGFDLNNNTVEILEIDVEPVDSTIINTEYQINVNEPETYKYVNTNNLTIGGFTAETVINPTNTLTFTDAGGTTNPDTGGTTNPDTGGTTNPDTGGTTNPDTGGTTNPDTGGTTNPDTGGTTNPDTGGTTNPDTGGTTNPDTGGTTNPDTGGTTNPDTGGTTNPDTGGTTNPDTGGTTNPDTNKFTDIANNHWAIEYINNFVQKGYIGGYEDNTFRPSNSITRAEFVKIINKAFGLTDTTTVDFKDINKENWYYTDILIAVKAGYINGYEDNTFRPNQPITRQEASKILATVINIKGDGVLSFKDNNEIANWAKEFVDALEDKQIIEGYEDNTFRPKGNMTRAEAVKIIDMSTK